MNSSGYWDEDKDAVVEGEVVEAETTQDVPSFDPIVGNGEEAYHQVFYDSDGLGIEHHQWVFPPMQDWGHVNDPHSRGFYVPGIREPVVLEWYDRGPMGAFVDYIGIHTGKNYAVRDLRYRRLIEYKRQKPYWQTPEGKREANYWTSTHGRCYAINKEQAGVPLPSYRTWARDFGERVLDQPEDAQAEKGRNNVADRLAIMSVVMPVLTFFSLVITVMLASGSTTSADFPSGWATFTLLLFFATIVTWVATVIAAVDLMGSRSKHNAKETVKWTGAGIGWGLLIKRLF